MHRVLCIVLTEIPSACGMPASAPADLGVAEHLRNGLCGRGNGLTRQLGPLRRTRATAAADTPGRGGDLEPQPSSARP